LIFILFSRSTLDESQLHSTPKITKGIVAPASKLLDLSEGLKERLKRDVLQPPYTPQLPPLPLFYFFLSE